VAQRVYARKRRNGGRQGTGQNRIQYNPVRETGIRNQRAFDTGLIEYDLSARASKVLYADSKIASISLNSEVAFFVENCTANRFYSGLELDTALSAGESAIHRLYLPSGQDEIIYKADGIAVCRPVSNQVIQIAVDNPEFIEYLLETGDLNNGANIPEYQWYLYNIADQTEQPYDPRLEDPNFWGSKK
jgi:hypothetical protein